MARTGARHTGPMSPRTLRAAAFAVALIALWATGCGGDGEPSTSGATTDAATGDEGSRAFVIVLENREYRQVIGASEAPYLNRLARRGALATHYYAISHPSLPNYLAIIGGTTFGIRSDCTSCSASGPSLPQQLGEAGVDWRAYMQGMPRSCYLGGYSGLYAKKHNPFYYFPAIVSDPASCNRVVPGGRIWADLHSGSLPSFGWITPNLCNDAHDCPLARSDRFLSRLVPALLPRLGRDGFLAVTFDEGLSDRGCCGARGGRVSTILAGPAVRRNARLAQPYTHYSLLATLERAFGLPLLRAARGAEPMQAAFTRAPALGRTG